MLYYDSTLPPATQRVSNHNIHCTQIWRNMSRYVIKMSRHIVSEWRHLLLFTSCFGLLLASRDCSLLRSWDALEEVDEKKKKVLSGDLFWAYQENAFEVWEHNLEEEMTPAYLLWVPLDLRGNFSPCLTFLTELDIFSFPHLFPWVTCGSTLDISGTLWQLACFQ